jgi:hypothetical protein
MIRKSFRYKCSNYAVFRRLEKIKKRLNRTVGSGVVSSIIE